MARNYKALSEKSQGLLVQYLEMCYNHMGIDVARKRYETIDCAVQMEMKDRREKIESYYDDITMPAVKPPVRKVSNFLIDIFVGSSRLFEMVSTDPANTEVVSQLNAVIEENSKTSKWAREMTLFLKDMPKYNIGGIECEWVESSENVLVNSSNPASNQASIKEATRAGNVLKRLDLYNTFYDTTVDVNRVADSGDFLGYIEKFSNTRLYKYIEDLKLSLGTTKLMNEKEIFQQASNSSRYFSAQVNPADSVAQTSSPMEQLFQGAFGTSPTSSGNDGEATPGHTQEVQVLYVRIIPKLFGIEVPNSDRVQVWKLHFYNWTTLISAEVLNNAHGTFPAFLCQIDEEGIKDQVKSAAELLIPMQNFQTKLYDARVAGIKRNLSDRALYNTSRIDKKHLDSNNPSAKIPVKPNLLSNSLGDAYQSIPYNDNLSGTILQELGFLHQTGQRISGLNDPQLGNFQKGNKTLGEFNEVMENADDDLRTWAKLVEANAIAPLKFILKMNMLQYQQATSLTAEGREVAVDPMAIRRAATDFKVADGLISKDSLMDLPTARGFFELLLQSPQLQQYYGEKLPDLVDYIFNSVGFETSKFKSATAQQALQTPPAGGAPDA